MNNLPPPIPPAVAQQTPSSMQLMRFENEKKSAGTALFLCWLTGLFGGHRFYLGRPHAVTMMLITIVSLPLCFFCVGFAGLIAMVIWKICDLFQVSRWTKEYNAALFARIQSGH